MTKMVLGVASASSCDASFRIWCLGVRSFSSCFPPLHSFTFCIVDSVRYLAGSYISVCSSIISVILRPPILVSSFIFFAVFMFFTSHSRMIPTTMPLNDYMHDLHSFPCFLPSSCILDYITQSTPQPTSFSSLPLRSALHSNSTSLVFERGPFIAQYHSISLAYPIMHCKLWVVGIQFCLNTYVLSRI